MHRALARGSGGGGGDGDGLVQLHMGRFVRRVKRRRTSRICIRVERSSEEEVEVEPEPAAHDGDGDDASSVN